MSPFVTMQLKSPLPYMSTPRRKVLAALEEISRRRELKKQPPVLERRVSNHKTTFKLTPQLRYYDLGSGDGETVLGAASIGWRSTGIELNSTLWALSSIRRWFSSSTIRNSSNFTRGDFWQHSIADADAVMIFGVKPLMPKIATKIAQECQPGTFVMSYRFHVPLALSNQSLVDQDRSEQHSVKVHSTTKEKGFLNATLVYDKDEMRIYELLQYK
jgi:hypothetical protein